MIDHKVFDTNKIDGITSTFILFEGDYPILFRVTDLTHMSKAEEAIAKIKAANYATTHVDGSSYMVTLEDIGSDKHPFDENSNKEIAEFFTARLMMAANCLHDHILTILQ